MKNCIYLIFLEIKDNKNNILLYTMDLPVAQTLENLLAVMETQI